MFARLNGLVSTALVVALFSTVVGCGPTAQHGTGSSANEQPAPKSNPALAAAEKGKEPAAKKAEEPKSSVTPWPSVSKARECKEGETITIKDCAKAERQEVDFGEGSKEVIINCTYADGTGETLDGNYQTKCSKDVGPIDPKGSEVSDLEADDVETDFGGAKGEGDDY